MSASGSVGKAPGEAVPASYKVWVFGSKLAGILAFAVGIEMLTRGALVWAGTMMAGGAALVVWPVGSPGEWGKKLPWRRPG